ncbi:mechanosensitive ion channel family protein [Yinghuangia seranimata]|uniref:mechanosensitive ion channel family protein n=1 Tax=Yinghuangia seranimata TaxID=408067 RepID=UPI00248B5D36|nr:mechanosensitive ion channel family protein [Yinghuangia seranimata]MDI2127343.1 mechanosensitive ion channel family protein [Yinghuangia seranimata]
MFVPGMPAVLLADAQQDGKVSSWFDRHGETLVVTPVRILIIVVAALVLRAVTRKMITQLIARMANDGANGSGRPVTGFLLNAERRRQRAETVGSVMRSMASFVILGIATLLVLSELHVDLAPLLASAGIAGIALGFGARNLVTDFLSGMFMILEDQYGVGDLVDAGPASGTVVEVGLRITKLRDADGTVWYIRNGEIKRIGNRSQGWGTAKVDVQIGYREDVVKVRDLVVTATEQLADDEQWSETVWGPGEVIGMESVTPEAVVLQVQVKTMPGQEQPVARELRARLKHAFDDAGVRLTEPRIAEPPAAGDNGGGSSAAAEPLPAPGPPPSSGPAT